MPLRPLLALTLLLASVARAGPPAGGPPSMSEPAHRDDNKNTDGDDRKTDKKDEKKEKLEKARRPDLRTVSGEISALAWQDRRFTVDGADGPVTLRVDRNTMVFHDDRIGTMRDLAIGTLVRANLGGKDNLASWIEVRPRNPPGKEPLPPVAAPGGSPSGATGTGTGAERGPATPIAPASPGPSSPAGPGPVPGGPMHLR